MDLGTKLQLKSGQHVDGVGVPDSLVSMLSVWSESALRVENAGLLVFIVDRVALEANRKRIVDSAASDCLTWVAYPKSGQLGTDLNRDSLVELLAAAGIQPVRQVVVDEVWSALRFRPG